MIPKNHIVTLQWHERYRSNSPPGPGSNSNPRMAVGFVLAFLLVAADAQYSRRNGAAIGIALDSSRLKLSWMGGGEGVGGILPEIHDHGLGLDRNKFADVS